MKNPSKTFLLILVLTCLSCVHPGICPLPRWPSIFFGGLIGVIVFFCLIVTIIYLLIDRDRLIKKIGEETPLDILKKRYARGELTKREYEKSKNELEG